MKKTLKRSLYNRRNSSNNEAFAQGSKGYTMGKVIMIDKIFNSIAIILKGLLESVF